MMRNKTYWKKVLELQEEYQSDIRGLREEFNKRISMEFDLAYSEMSRKLRALFVDVNYELFNSSDSFLRGKVYAFMSHGLAMFHDKAYEKRPMDKKLPLLEEEETSGDTRTKSVSSDTKK